MIASNPGSRPAFHRLLQATKSWMRAWVRGWGLDAWTDRAGRLLTYLGHLNFSASHDHHLQGGKRRRNLSGRPTRGSPSHPAPKNQEQILQNLSGSLTRGSPSHPAPKNQEQILQNLSDSLTRGSPSHPAPKNQEQILQKPSPVLM